MTPIAEIVGGTLRWHIPHDSYAVPVEYLSGVHMLYDAAQSEEYDPLTEDLIERLRTTDVAPMNALSLEAADALQAQVERMSTLTRSIDDREARVVRMRDMLSRASQADNDRLRGEVKMHERSASAKDAEIARLTHAVDDREASLIRMRDMLNQSRADLVRLLANGIHSCHADCTRSGCVNARLREENEALRADAERYLWLRDEADSDDWEAMGGLVSEMVDAAVDAARGTTPRNVTALESLRAWNAETDPDVASALDDLTKSRGTT